MAKAKAEDGAPVVIKKYANRRLYNTNSSSYVTLDDLCDMVKEGVDFVVYDAKSGEDITRSVLTQIIFDQETKGASLLPIGFLRQLIGYYDDHLRALVPSYLEVAMANFERHQEQIRDTLQTTFGDLWPLQQMQELGKQNMAMFQQALAMFSPFAQPDSGAPASGAGEKAGAKGPGDDLQSLRSQLERMQKQLDALADRD